MSWDSGCSLWQARFRRTDGTSHFIGHFQKAEAAACAYDEYALQQSGPAAVRNAMPSTLTGTLLQHTWPDVYATCIACPELSQEPCYNTHGLMCELLALHAQYSHRNPALNTWPGVYAACIACMIAVPRPMLCMLMSSFDILKEGREDAGEGHLGGSGWWGGEGGGLG